MDTYGDEKTLLLPQEEQGLPAPVTQQPIVTYDKWYNDPVKFFCACLVWISFLLVMAFYADGSDDLILGPDISVSSTSTNADFNITYLSVPGFFKQDRFGANETKIGPAPDRFGLIDGKGKYWTKFVHTVDKLNERAGPYVSYKVLYVSRHGEGFHNVGMDYYGEDEWDKKWGRKNGNGTITWGPDAELTPQGVQQAIRVHQLWTKEMDSGGGVPLPTRLFVSPMSRALNTFQVTFSSIVDDPPPLILEGLRDTYGLRTADLRHNKTWIHQTYPAYEFEEGFTEQDELWKKDERETDEHTQQRVQEVLDRLLKYRDTYMAVVAHSNVVEAIFKLTKHHNFDVPTGGVVPVLVKVMTNQM